LRQLPVSANQLSAATGGRHFQVAGPPKARKNASNLIPVSDREATLNTTELSAFGGLTPKGRTLIP
jgi:hypothetical protein